MASDWQASLSFSERLGFIQKIQAATGHLTNAKRLETEAYKVARSRDEYQSIVQAASAKVEPVRCPDVAQQPFEHHEQSHPGSEGQTIGKYKTAHHHRDGVSSAIFRAHHPTDVGVVVALKVTHPSTQTPPHNAKREARLLKKAASPYVVPLIEKFEQSGGNLVLAFPFMPFDLAQLLEQGGLTDWQRQTYLRDLLTGLSHVHALGIIHRDIKPSNVLLKSRSGPAVIADFGTAWSQDDPASEPPNQKILDVGTTSYRPPELLFGYQSYDKSLDLWAMGCVVAQVVGLGSRTLFDSGDLGSELALIKSIFETLGTPDLTVWPEAAGFSDWGKMSFYEYPGRSWAEILPSASDSARDLASAMIKFESGDRLTARQVRRAA